MTRDYGMRWIVMTGISEALMTAYYGILVVSPRLSYGMALLLRGCSSIHYTRVFRLKKLAVGIATKLQYKEL